LFRGKISIYETIREAKTKARKKVRKQGRLLAGKRRLLKERSG